MSDVPPESRETELGAQIHNSPSPAPSRLSVVLVEPEIAANTGAIGRSCVAAGARLWLVRPLGFHLDDRYLRRAGLDYWDHLDLKVINHLDEVTQVISRDRLWSFSTKAGSPYWQADFRPADALVFGPESRGLPRSWLEQCPDRCVRIPIRPQARSLNLSCAVAIALFEAVRQIEKGSER
ncbi:MAG: tRNA (cytidine(34)-2'-O)-methyltransferase [Planctomycetaceae bacterium]|nr:tRNA (cytidine(34)-2'-O)-methyltransferase [Planctomycetaceae bacterium]